MKPAPSASAARASALTAAPPPLLRFLAACHADFSMGTGAPSPTISELGKADPEHFGISLATLDGMSTSRRHGIPFTIQSMSKPFVFALALDRSARRGWKARSASNPPATLQFDPPQCDNHPFNPMVNAAPSPAPA